jgi:hypothetical protein
VILRRDERGRLHSENGPALQYPDGFAIWAWHGLRVPADLIVHPELITTKRITQEQNAELRRVMLERYGLERYMRDMGAKRVQGDDYGNLYRVELAGDEPIVMVEVENSTPEPDGTMKMYMLRVPPMCTTAREAVAWTFGLTPEQYEPAMET